MRVAISPGSISALAHGDMSDPFAVLGLHICDGGAAWELRVFDPHATAVQMLSRADGSPLATLGPVPMPVAPPPKGKDKAAKAPVNEAPNSGLWVVRFDQAQRPPDYRLRFHYGDTVYDSEDPYRFGPVLGDLDCHLLAEGTHLHAYEKLGAHPATRDGVDGVTFAVWAPNARRVSVVGPFNTWDGRRHPMRKRADCGVWEIFIPHIGAGELYKFEIKAADGRILPLKFDPYALYAEKRPSTAAVVHGLKGFDWTDGDWMAQRAKNKGGLHSPMSIYEVHLGSWRRKGEAGEDFLSYRELAETLVPYVAGLGFTHIELLPIHEFPFDGSWGYQPIGLYAPTSRYGTPEDFKALIDACHAAGLGVIIDWVPGHFPKDSHGLGQFDGTHLYEHADPRQGEHRDWGTLIYNFGRSEVRNFLIANALYWIEHFHIDGLRVDAVASMLYLDYSREDGDWIPNAFGGNENLEAIDFLKKLNEAVYGLDSGAITIAEESTAWPMVSRPTYLGGLGFGYKWNMGWMHDTLEYFKKDPIHRRYHHNQLTFGLVYAFNENFCLPLSHDEVVHGKGSLFGRMAGDRWQKFANLRAYYAFMWAHPGKKLLFMGGEFGQEREWNFDASLDWHLLQDTQHSGVQELIRHLNHQLKALPALHGDDFTPAGFEWIDCQDSDTSVLSWIRKPGDQATGQTLIVVSNLTPLVRDGYRIGVPTAGPYHCILNTDAQALGGSGVQPGPNPESLTAEPTEHHGRPHSLTLTLPPLATLYLVAD
jgi:1,4-alpha-glucan branching enzyme